jgi:hypothetical protein
MRKGILSACQFLGSVFAGSKTNIWFFEKEQ